MLIKTNISSNYVPKWGSYEGIREIIQNALDSHDEGNEMSIVYVRSKNALMVTNKNVTLSMKSLMLGSSEKATKNARGKHGEGFKIGALALTRSGKEVKIHNGRSKDMWQFIIDKHTQLEEDTLSIKVNKNKSTHSGSNLVVEIGGVSPEEWRSLKTQFLPLCDIGKESRLSTPYGYVLLDKMHIGKVYCGGIFVTTVGDMSFGYDFKPSILELNRDRDMVNSFQVFWNTSKMWVHVATAMKGKQYDINKMLKDNIPDVQYLKEFTDYKLSEQIVTKFLAEHGDKAYPVTNDGDARTVRSMGYNPIYSGSSYSGVLSSKLGTVPELQRRVSMEWSLFHKITPVDDANIQWVFEVLYKIDPKFQMKMSIAKFSVDATKCIYDEETDSIIMSHAVLKDKYEMLRLGIEQYATKHKLESSRLWKKLYKTSIEGIDEE